MKRTRKSDLGEKKGQRSRGGGGLFRPTLISDGEKKKKFHQREFGRELEPWSKLPCLQGRERRSTTRW